MSDPRFARLKSDPRFRRPKTKTNKVVIDERFKSVFDKKKNAGRKVDKYGRPVSETQAQDNLRRYYRLEVEDDERGEDSDAGEAAEAEAPRIPDLARGEVMLESSDEEDDEERKDDSDSDDGGFVTLGRDSSRPIAVHDDEAEIDLDEDNFSDLDAQAAAYSRAQAQDSEDEADSKPAMERTARLAVVNLDWDHVRANHLYKICASLVSPTAPIVRASATSSSSTPAADEADRLRGKVASSSKGRGGKGASAVTVVRGRVLSVRVYPSDFGKARMTREETEGPPPEIFKKKDVENPEEVDERNVYEVGGEDEYDEDALRKYQLERLRYYYAIVTCDTVDAASHIYNELEGTELERSANVFDMSFVPDDMTFDNEPRDEATDEANTEYKAVDFVTDALRHSKVKLTWDEDDPERNQITRRALSKKEIEENDFRAYIANTSSESESDAKGAPKKNKKDKKEKKKASRDKLRALLLGGNGDAMPEGWGGDDVDANGGDDDDVDMEITFTPGLSATKEGEETTLERYQRKMREKRKKRKEEVKDKDKGKAEGRLKGEGKKAKDVDDEFFEADSEDDVVEPPVQVEETLHKSKGKGKKSRRAGGDEDEDEVKPVRKEATEEELALLVASNNPDAEPKHFSLKSVIKAEKGKKHRKGRKVKGKEDDGEAQEDFVVDVKDDRFKALFEDHHYAIDPTNPHFKKTKAMGALLEERQKRQRELRDQRPEGGDTKQKPVAEGTGGGKSLQSLVESVKRKSANIEPPGKGKRRKLL